MVERGGRLSVRRQSELLGLSRSSLYYTPRGGERRGLGAKCVRCAPRRSSPCTSPPASAPKCNLDVEIMNRFYGGYSEFGISATRTRMTATRP